MKIEEGKYPIVDHMLAKVFGTPIAKLNHDMWSDEQREHALTCLKVHVGVNRCRRLDTPDFAEEK